MLDYYNDTIRATQAQKPISQFGRFRMVEACCGFIKHEDARIGHHGAGDLEQLLLAIG